jgi:hypothetical protein
MGKSRFAPHTQRFANVPRGSCLYAAELTNGLIKIGCSGSAQGRLMSLANEARRFLGADVARYHVVKRPFEFGGRKAEVTAIKRLGAIGRAAAGRQEYFLGVTFEQAVAAITRQPEVKAA